MTDRGAASVTGWVCGSVLRSPRPSSPTAGNPCRSRTGPLDTVAPGAMRGVSMPPDASGRRRQRSQCDRSLDGCEDGFGQIRGLVNSAAEPFREVFDSSLTQRLCPVQRVR